MLTASGKKRKTLAADTEQLLRIIQSIPSPKAEPFKLWLAMVGFFRSRLSPSGHALHAVHGFAAAASSLLL